MPEDMKAWQVRHAAYDVIWHFRSAATTVGHSFGPWGGVAALVQNSLAEVRNERARCMNIIGGAYARFNRLPEIMSGRNECVDPEAVLEELITYCNLAMADLKVSRLRQILEDAARDNSTARREPRS